MKKPYADMTAAELQAEKAELEKRYNDLELVLKSESLSTETKERVSKIGRITSLIFIYIFISS